MSLDVIFGNAVTGVQRFSRPNLEARLLRSLAGGSGIKMFGLRRIGKSTLRLCATEHFEATSRPHLSLDGQGLHSLRDFLGQLILLMPGEKSLMGRALSVMSASPVKAALDAIVKGTDHEEKVLSVYWHLVSDGILNALKCGPKPVLIIDEFTYLISNIIKRNDQQGRDDVDKLLASMRQWRGAGMTMLLTGSIGLTGLVRKHELNLEHLNDLQPFQIPELTPQEAKEFIRQATEKSNGAWTEAHTEEFLRQSGVFYPCFLVRGLLEIGTETPLDVSEFDRVFAEYVRPDLHADFYSQFNRRFHAYGDLPGEEQKTLLLPALKAVMEAEADCLHEDIPLMEPWTQVNLALALSMLVDDGFIHFSEDMEGRRRWKPASRLAQMWWKRSKLA